MEPGPDEDEVLESEVEGAEPEHKRVCRNAYVRPTAAEYESSTWSTLYLQDSRVADESKYSRHPCAVAGLACHPGVQACSALS